MTWIPIKQTSLKRRLICWKRRMKYYTDIVLQEESIVRRFSGVGKLSKEDGLRLGTVGPVLRASGVPRDIRKDDPYSIYSELDFKVITDDHADVLGRTIVRIKELTESIKICRQVLRQIPDGPIVARVPLKIPAGEALSRYEAPRGEDVHYVRSNGTDKPDRVKVPRPVPFKPGRDNEYDGGRISCRYAFDHRSDRSVLFLHRPNDTNPKNHDGRARGHGLAGTSQIQH